MFTPVQNYILIFAVMMLIVLLAPLLAARLRIAGMSGLILAGMLAGPHGLGLLERNQTIEMLSAVGALFILFLAGLELDLHQFVRHRRQSLAFGTLSFSLPLILGLGAGLFILKLAPLSAVLAAVMLASRTLLAYPLLSGMGLGRNRAVTVAIGGTMLADTLALLLLAVAAEAAQGLLSPFFGIQLFAFLLVYVVVMLWAVPKIAHWFFVNIASDGIVEFVFVLTALFFCSWIAHCLKLEPILGAFLAGLAFNRLIPQQSVLMNRLQFVGHALFIPFFLISVGMLVNLRLVLSNPQFWLTAGVMLGTSIFAKWLAARLSQRLLGYSQEEGGLLFGLSLSQAAVTSATILIGFELKLFDEAILAGGVIMILGSCMMGMATTEKHARQLALLEQAHLKGSGKDEPARIAISLANPMTEKKLLELALLLRSPAGREPLYALTITPEGPDADERAASAEKLLEQAVVYGAAADVTITPIIHVDTNIVQGVAHALRDLRASTLILGWNGRVSGGYVFGSVIDGIVRAFPQMVMVAHIKEGWNVFKRLLVLAPPFIERQPGFKAAAAALKLLAGQLGTQMVIFSRPESPLPSLMQGSVPASGAAAGEPVSVSNDWLQPLQQQYVNGDLVVMLMARRGDAAWQPRHERLPALISRHMPHVPLLAIYPASRLRSETMPEEDAAEPWRILHEIPAEQAWFNQDGTGLETFLSALTDSAFRGVAHLRRQALDSLLEACRQAPIELAPGLVLLHAHMPDLAESLVFLGVNRSGFQFPASSVTARALLVLLASGRQPPEAHLHRLAELAQLARIPHVVEKFCEARSLPELLLSLKPPR